MLILSLLACLAPVDDSPTGVFEYVWSDYDAMYGPFEQRGVDWDAVYDDHAPLVSDDMSDDALHEVLCSMLAELDDGHVKLLAPDHEVFDSNHIYRDRLMEGTFDIDLIEESYLQGKIDHGPWDWYTSAKLADDVPYLWLPGIDDDALVIHDIAREYPHATAFVLDLRHSHGGVFPLGLEAMRPLTDRDVYAFKSRTRNGPERGSFDEWTRWTVEATDGKLWDVPVILLTDGETISASERMVMALQELPDTVTIGVPTNGAQATSILRQAPNGWTYQLPVQEVVGADGVVYEGVGLPVDIELLDDPADVEAGRDEVLEAALELAESYR